MTGHVAYSLDCERWRHGCGSCPYPDEYPAVRRDATALNWRLKRAVYARSRLTLVVPSRWMQDMVRQSPLLARFPVERIPHGVDTDAYRPLDRAAARRRLGLGEDESIALFTAYDLTERRKGLHLLEAALERLDPQPLLVLAGSGDPPLLTRAARLGQLDDADLALAYSAADVLVAPTIADALTQNTGEALACGTPVVSFDRGGVADVTVHMESGYQARFGDVDDLARGIATVLADPGSFAERCRARAESELSLALQVRRYAELYERILGADRPSAAPPRSRIRSV